MIKLIRHISLFCCLSLMASLGSCNSDDMNGGSDRSASNIGGDVNLTLNVSIGNTSGTRQTRDGEENNFSYEQTDFSHEKIKTLRVIIVRPDNTIEFNRLIEPKDRNATTLLNAANVEKEDLRFRVSTNQGNVDNVAMTCTERKRIYLIANEASLDNFESNIVGDGQKLSDLLKGLTAAYNPSEKEEEEGAVGRLGDKLDPYKVERWIIFNRWDESGDSETNVNNLTAKPIIDNEAAEEDKTFIPMTEFFDVDVVSTWKNEKGDEDSEDNNINVLPEQKADLFVTRNFVKFQFSAWSETEKFDVVDLRFENVMQKEYLFPMNTIYDPVKAINNTVDRQIVSFQTPGTSDNFVRPAVIGSKTETPLMAFNPPATDEEAAVIKPAVCAPLLYFCETQNFVANENKLSLYRLGADVLFYKVDGSTELVSFESVELKNLPYSLPRNTIVKVDLRIKDRKLDAVATVYPYTAVNLNPEFGFARPENDVLTIPPTMEIQMGQMGLIYPTYTTKKETDLSKLNIVWVASDPSIVLLDPADNTEDKEDLRYVQPSESIELPYLDPEDDKKTVPVRVIPQKAGTTVVTAYSQTGLVARCTVTVK